MKKINHWVILSLTLTFLFLTGCSSTKNLPADETLYVGIKDLKVTNKDKSEVGLQAMEEVEAAFSYPPNTSIMGSSSLRHPFAFGLWIFNGFQKYQDQKGLGNWIFRKLGTTPVYMSTVRPETRAKIATNLLHDFGFFNGTVTHQVDTMKNPRKTKASYFVDMGKPYYLDTLMYVNFPQRADSLIRAHYDERLLRRNDHFSVLKLESERTRLYNLFRNHGYFYYRPEYVTFFADTIQRPGYVAMKITNRNGLPERTRKQYYIGNTTFTLFDSNRPSRRVTYDSIQIGDIIVRYTGEKPGLRPSVIQHRYYLRKGRLYSQMRQTITQDALTRLGIFKMTEFTFTPKDSTATCDTLNVDVMAMFDQPYEASLELNAAMKSTDQAGPGAVLSVTKKNFLRSAASLSFQLKGSYEWQTNASGLNKEERNRLNSYELGASVALEYPGLILPWTNEGGNRYRFPSHTTFKLYANQLNRARFFQMLSFGGTISYDFQNSRKWKHTVTPFRLTFNTLQHTTAEFDSIIHVNQSLALSLSNQFIPAMGYTFTYDNSRDKLNHRYWWETSITSAGNITSLIYAALGKGLKEREKKFLNSSFAQFVKLTSEWRALFNVNGKHQIATRLMGGIIYSYGNQLFAPYSEQFYIGGANSIRAFTIRSLGPGSYHPDAANRFGYIDEAGDIKLEANVEYRFPLIGKLNGAAFLDAGNIWLLREDESRPGGKFTFKKFGKNLALGTGFGLRYDMEFLVVRVDLGVALHAPYDTGKSGYYNIPRFKDALGLHLAIGYPF